MLTRNSGRIMDRLSILPDPLQKGGSTPTQYTEKPQVMSAQQPAAAPTTETRKPRTRQTRRETPGKTPRSNARAIPHENLTALVVPIQTDMTPGSIRHAWKRDQAFPAGLAILSIVTGEVAANIQYTQMVVYPQLDASGEIALGILVREGKAWKVASEAPKAWVTGSNGSTQVTVPRGTMILKPMRAPQDHSIPLDKMPVYNMEGWNSMHANLPHGSVARTIVDGWLHTRKGKRRKEDA